MFRRTLAGNARADKSAPPPAQIEIEAERFSSMGLTKA